MPHYFDKLNDVLLETIVEEYKQMIFRFRTTCHKNPIGGEIPCAIIACWNHSPLKLHWVIPLMSTRISIVLCNCCYVCQSIHVAMSIHFQF